MLTAVTCKYTHLQVKCYQYDKEGGHSKVSVLVNVTAVTCKYTHLQDGKVKCYQYDKEGGLLINSKVSDCYQGLVLGFSCYMQVHRKAKSSTYSKVTLKESRYVYTVRYIRSQIV